MAKYNYSVSRRNIEGLMEKLEVTGCDSFEEAVSKVEKGLHDRKLSEKESLDKISNKEETDEADKNSRTTFFGR